MAVFLSPVGGVAAQFFTNTGAVLTGGKIYTYAAGTTTPVTTYTTSAGNVAHTNPIILDAAGRVPSGEIWLTTSIIYKFVLKDSNDVLIGTYDNISAASASDIYFTGFKGQVGTVQDLADNDGSDWIGFLPAGTGATARSAQDKMRDSVSVKDFGAVGDGVANDTVAIQLAIDSSDGFIFFPAGEYLISAPIVLPTSSFYSNEKLRGFTGSGATILADVDAAHIITGPASGYASRWVFENLSYTSAPGSTDSGIFNVTKIYNSWWSHNTFANVTGSVFYTPSYCQSITIESNHFGSCHYVVDFELAYTLTFNENYLEACDYGVIVDGLNDPAVWAGRIQNNVIEGSSPANGGLPISLGACYGVVISGNYMEANQGPAIDTNDCYIKLNNGAVPHRGLVISNNMFQPTAGQKADAAFAVVRLGNFPVTDVNSRPAVFGNVSSGPILVNDPSLLSAYYSNECTGQTAGTVGPVLQNKQAWITSASLAFVNNRATAYNSGTATWNVFKITGITDITTMSFDGFLRMYSSNGTGLGVTYFTFKIAFAIVGGVLTPKIIQQVTLQQQALIAGGDAYWNSGGTTVVGTSVSGNDCTITFNFFNDVSLPTYGLVYSLGPIVSAVTTVGSYKNTQITFA